MNTTHTPTGSEVYGLGIGDRSLLGNLAARFGVWTGPMSPVAWRLDGFVALGLATRTGNRYELTPKGAAYALQLRDLTVKAADRCREIVADAEKGAA